MHNYSQEMLDSIKKVEETRKDRLNMELKRIAENEKADLLNTFHPDYNKDAFTTLCVGVNKGDKVAVMKKLFYVL